MSSDRNVQQVAYGGYFKRETPAPDLEITATDPGTPMGEYMRRFWQPVCLSVELTDLPKSIRIMGEHLVAFRDRSGRVGVLHRNCSHRGTSLEFGIVQSRGIRCCYHGWVWDVDGRLLETPAEPEDSKLKDRVFQGAYPAFERDGLVFAYMGAPDQKPDFPVFDSYVYPKGTKLVPFSNVYPCNWMQVHENIMDHMHTALLHNNMTVAGVDATEAGLNLLGFGDMPVMQWYETRNGNAIIFIASRRVAPEKVWVRITEMYLPNIVHIGSLMPSAASVRHAGVCLTRWHVPVDNTHSIIFGWRHFNDEVDPDHIGDEAKCGVDAIDFLVGQTGGRTYEEGQRAPGDWEALCSQRPIAIHAAETPGFSDTGVYLYRKLVRNAVRGKTPADSTRVVNHGGNLHTYGQDSVLHAPERPKKEDRALLKQLGLKVLAIMKEGDALPSRKRDAHIRKRLDELDGGAR
ncbi:MAG: ring-hydroxylating oxygenase subunit alpha [Alphaproteobacteria bacterium]|nr:ring-hydroxylating oxygenase subunit alpha [Alphaproteobacteria bacterium]